MRCIHLARSPSRSRKWDLEIRYRTTEGTDRKSVITSYNAVSQRTLPWTEAERVCLVTDFCRHYYMAGCAESELSQLFFLNDPTFYVDQEKPLAAITKDLEEYHALRPNRHLELVAAPEIVKLAEKHFLVACAFTASRGEGTPAYPKTDIMQIRFIQNEPRIVCLISLP